MPTSISGTRPNTTWYPYLSVTPSHGWTSGDVSRHEPALRHPHLSGRVSRLERREDRQRRRGHRWPLGRRDDRARPDEPRPTEVPTPSSAGCHRPTPSADAIELLDRQMTRAALPGCPPHGTARPTRSRPRRAARAAGTRPGVRADGASRSARRGRRGTWPASPTSSSWSSTRAGPARPPTTSSPCGRRASTPWPRRATTSSANSPVWPCHSVPWTPKAFAPWIEHAIEVFGLTAACSPATSRSMPWPGRSTSCTTRSPPSPTVWTRWLGTSSLPPRPSACTACGADDKADLQQFRRGQNRKDGVCSAWISGGSGWSNSLVGPTPGSMKRSAMPKPACNAQYGKHTLGTARMAPDLRHGR